MGKAIQKAGGTRRKAGQHMSCSCVRGIIRKVAYHAEETELSLVEECLARKAASHEVGECMVCTWE